MLRLDPGPGLETKAGRSVLAITAQDHAHDTPPIEASRRGEHGGQWRGDTSQALQLLGRYSGAGLRSEGVHPRCSSQAVARRYAIDSPRDLSKEQRSGRAKTGLRV